ncbi:MAG: 2-oxoglutarate dehydrogenase E1 component [Gammaproteobacteria bacterium]|nr:2-oxoglutarate dehydrogenase E1 component [Gammaproteobacteria bacterium]
MTAAIESVLSGTNLTFVTEVYSRFLRDPHSVDASWAKFFTELGDDSNSILKQLHGASWNCIESSVIGQVSADESRPLPDVAPASTTQITASTRAATLQSIRALMMIRAYRVRGHLIARFDPLGLEGNDSHPELDYHNYGFTEADLDQQIFIDHVLGLEFATLRQILQILRDTYCGTIGVEFMHIQEPDQKSWIQRRIESIHNQTQFTEKGKLAIYERLVEAEGFEQFLHIKHTGTKRFGLDGGESLIPALEQILKRGGQLGVKEVVIGMPHRGRLNVLANVMRKPYRAIFSEFLGKASQPDEVQGSGDVKYHLGASADREFDGNQVHLSLTANPSHLEAVNPVVLGKVRAKQTHTDDQQKHHVMGLLMHGDAAFAGQGLVPESLDLSQLMGYRTGGTIHFIVNNQIGFTTSPGFSRSSPYPSDVAKMIQAPIFHVNGDDPEAVVHVARIATEYRQEFKHDVVIDMFCYRRYGHNESDEPSFTQPIMYRAIAGHDSTRNIYARRLIEEGLHTQESAAQVESTFREHLNRAFNQASEYKLDKADWLDGKWKGLSNLKDEEELKSYDTAVSVEGLREIGQAISTAPHEFAVHRKLLRQLKNKRKLLDAGAGIDWATAEALAFGSLLCEGTPVRLSGQDSGRGTFSQRHSVLVHQEDQSKYIPLNNIRQDQARFEVIDSPLSEAAVLGFEYGYTLSDPSTLVLWEAQFGDFANGAQMIIDQFISSGESKWLRMSGLVMLLPHGYEGQGPEHSSARLERYLQSCAQDNMQVVNITTPANYFHALRRQVHSNFRKPLVVMAPKSLLRHKLCVSKLDDMGPGTHFRRVIGETATLVSDDKVKRVILCSGKVYYDLVQEREERGIDDVAIIRLEQIYPWPRDRLIEQIGQYKSADLIWCQEESANMGAWMFVLPRLQYILDMISCDNRRPVYVGRNASASPATGYMSAHINEQKLLLEQALTWSIAEIAQPFKRDQNLSELAQNFFCDCPK